MVPKDTGPKQATATANPTESVNPSINPSDPPTTTTVHLTDGAGGIAENKKQNSETTENQKAWYVVYVSPRAEKKVCESLLKAKYEAYIPTRWEIHLWQNGQRKKVEQVLIHGVVFVKIASTQTDEIRLFPMVYSFMMDPARKNTKANVRSFAIIRESEMRLLKAMVGQEEYDVDFATRFSVGEHVRIAGFENYEETAQIVKLPNDKQTYVGVRVGFLGCAYMKVPINKILKIQSPSVPA